MNQQPLIVGTFGVEARQTLKWFMVSHKVPVESRTQPTVVAIRYTLWTVPVKTLPRASKRAQHAGVLETSQVQVNLSSNQFVLWSVFGLLVMPSDF